MIDKEEQFNAKRNGFSENGSRMFKVAISAMQGRTSHLLHDGKATLEAHRPETSATAHAASNKSDCNPCMNSFTSGPVVANTTFRSGCPYRLSLPDDRTSRIYQRGSS